MLALIDYYVCQANKLLHNGIKQTTRIRTGWNATVRKCSWKMGIYEEILYIFSS